MEWLIGPDNRTLLIFLRGKGIRVQVKGTQGPAGSPAATRWQPAAGTSKCSACASRGRCGPFRWVRSFSRGCAFPPHPALERGLRRASLKDQTLSASPCPLTLHSCSTARSPPPCPRPSHSSEPGARALDRSLAPIPPGSDENTKQCAKFKCKRSPPRRRRGRLGRREASPHRQWQLGSQRRKD